MHFINPYVGFNGKCLAAMNFYQQGFGGELELQKFDDPAGSPDDNASGEKILHASLHLKGLQIIMGTDMTEKEGFIKGNNIALAISCESEEEITSLFQKLAHAGRPVSPLQEYPWGGIFGSVDDQFGIRWMLNYDKPKV